MENLITISDKESVSDFSKERFRPLQKRDPDLCEKHPNNNKTDRNKTDIMGSACVNSISVEQLFKNSKIEWKSVTFFKVVFEMNTEI